ncbi:MAG: glycosyltransferase [bacterium]
MIKILKKYHNSYLVYKMLHKKESLFGNRIQVVEGLAQNNLKPIDTQINPISIIILNHNNGNILPKCLDSLIKYNDYGYRIIVVDNLSADKSVEFLGKKYKNIITIVRNKINGCASGRNLGAIEAGQGLLVFLDSDQGPTAHNWLDNYLQILLSDPKVGAIGSNGGFFTERDLTGPLLSLFPNLGMKQGVICRTNIDYLETSGFLIRKTLFDKIGGFDDHYDPYIFEDADLSRKIVKSNHLLCYSPYLSAYHDAHSTTKSDQAGQDYLTQFSNNAAYFRKKWL